MPLRPLPAMLLPAPSILVFQVVDLFHYIVYAGQHLLRQLGQHLQGAQVLVHLRAVGVEAGCMVLDVIASHHHQWTAPRNAWECACDAGSDTASPPQPQLPPASAKAQVSCGGSKAAASKLKPSSSLAQQASHLLYLAGAGEHGGDVWVGGAPRQCQLRWGAA